jgi:hypothetical protein
MRSSIFILLTLLCCCTYSQSDSKSIEIQNRLWGDVTPEFQATIIPEKWENEPAVILAISNDLGYKKLPIVNKLWEYNYFHERTKILSQQALEKYSQFSYPENNPFNSSRATYVGFKIIKPDGKEIVVSTSDAVKEEIASKSGAKFATMKLAIPNLEIGDIIDYYIAKEATFFTSKFHSFDPAIFQLRRKYATVYGRVNFHVMRRCFINLKTYNGAPSFHYIQDVVGEDDMYSLEYRDQEKVEDFPWFYPFRSLPTVKFKVTYASPMAAYQYPSLIDKDNPGILKSHVSDAELKALVTGYMNSLYDLTGLQKYMKKSFKGVSDKFTLAQEAFLYERHSLSVKYADVSTVNGGITPTMSAFRLVDNLSEYYKKAKIPHDIILGVPKSIGELDDIILEEELMIGLKTRTNPPLYIASFTAHSLPNEINEEFQGSTVYISDRDVNDLGWKFVKYSIPESKASNNSELSSCSVEIDIDNLITSISLQKSFSGLTKIDEQKRFLDAFDYQEDENKKYQAGSSLVGMDYKALTEFNNRKNAYLKNRGEERNKKLKEHYESRWDFSIDSLKDFKIVKQGRTIEESSFEYQFNCTTAGLIHKVGDNFLFDVGLLIEQQMHISKEFKGDREFDIFMNYPRLFRHEINLKMPAGYEVQGLEKLNTEVSNETGRFKSSATLTEDNLKIIVEKEYNHSHEPASSWVKMLEFLDAADNFSSVKVLFRKEAEQ